MEKTNKNNLLTIVIYLILYQICIIPFIMGKIATNVYIYALSTIIGLVASYFFIRRLWHFFDQQTIFVGIKTRHPYLELVIFIAAIFITGYLTSFLPESNNQKEVVSMIRSNTFNTILTTVIISPICEELIFRGLFAKLFFPQANDPKKLFWYVVINSLAFAFAHDLNFSFNIVPYFIMGVILSLAYVRFEDIRYNMFLHSLNNFLAGITILVL